MFGLYIHSFHTILDILLHQNSKLLLESIDDRNLTVKQVIKIIRLLLNSLHLFLAFPPCRQKETYKPYIP